MSGSVTIEVLNEGCFLGLLVPAAMVSCSSSAYRFLCNCYYFFLSLTLFLCSPLRDFSILHAYVHVYVHVPFFPSTFTSSILHAYVHVYVFKLRLHVYVHFFNYSRSRLQFFTSSFWLSILQHVYVHVFNSSRRPRNS